MKSYLPLSGSARIHTPCRSRVRIAPGDYGNVQLGRPIWVVGRASACSPRRPRPLRPHRPRRLSSPPSGTRPWQRNELRDRRSTDRALRPTARRPAAKRAPPRRYVNHAPPVDARRRAAGEVCKGRPMAPPSMSARAFMCEERNTYVSPTSSLTPAFFHRPHRVHPLGHTAAEWLLAVNVFSSLGGLPRHRRVQKGGRRNIDQVYVAVGQ